MRPPFRFGRYAIHSSVEPGWKSQSTRTPSFGDASVQEPPLTDESAPDKSASTASDVSGMPLSASTVRMSDEMPRVSAIRFTPAASLIGGL